MSEKTVILDLDGTLVDSVYVHTLAWQRAFAAQDVHVPGHRIHRLIGMGGDRLVTHAAGEEVERSCGDELRRGHQEALDDLFDDITPTEGAADLMFALREQGYRLVLATSGERDQADRLLRLLGDVEDTLETTVTGSDAEQSKPAGDLLSAALRAVGAERGLVIGDSVWDVKAARDVGLPTVGLLTGGISEGELLDAGADHVVESPRSLLERLTGATSPFGTDRDW